MRLRLLSVAEAELAEVLAYYEEKEAGLGRRFYLEFRLAVERMQAHPRAWLSLSPNTRRCRVKNFPYGVIYQMRKDEILVVAVASLQREPGYWRDRLR